MISFISSLLIAHYSDNDENIKLFITTLPSILGMLLAGILAALAIIFGMTGLQELHKIRAIEKERKSNIYKKMLDELRNDTYLVFIIVIISAILPILLNNTRIIEVQSISQDVIYCFRLNRILFVVDFIIFTMSLIATYDIIKSLFEICEFKYESAKNKL